MARGNAHLRLAPLLRLARGGCSDPSSNGSTTENRIAPYRLQFQIPLAERASCLPSRYSTWTDAFFGPPQRLSYRVARRIRWIKTGGRAPTPEGGWSSHASTWISMGLRVDSSRPTDPRKGIGHIECTCNVWRIESPCPRHLPLGLLSTRTKDGRAQSKEQTISPSDFTLVWRSDFPRFREHSQNRTLPALLT